MRGGTAAPSSNFTTAGGYTPIPDQQSMGGLGAGDVFIDCCGETVPVRDPSLSHILEIFLSPFPSSKRRGPRLLFHRMSRCIVTRSPGYCQHQPPLPSTLQGRRRSTEPEGERQREVEMISARDLIAPPHCRHRLCQHGSCPSQCAVPAASAIPAPEIDGRGTYRSSSHSWG
jgi:hypothetical protein